MVPPPDDFRLRRFDEPEPDYVQSMRECWQDSVHARTLVGLMAQQNLRFLPLAGTSNHGVPWAAIVVQGEPEVTALREAADRLRHWLERHRDEHRDGADGN
ncbi:MAG: hypothetical protein WAT39_23970 [Planctomycetota bacterium]